MDIEETKTVLSTVPILILVGGLGKRLGDASKDKPKCMVDIGGEPFINHQLRLLAGKGAHEIVLLTGHLGDQIREQVGDGKQFGLNVSYSDDGKKALGTGGAVEKVAKTLNDTVAVLYGDTYLDIPMAAVCQRFQKCAQPALMTLLENHEVIRRQESNVEYDRSKTLVKAYNKEKPSEKMRHIDYGLSFFNADIFKQSKQKGAYDLAETFKELAKSERLAGYEVQNRYYDVNTPENLIETRAYLSQNNLW